MGLESLNVTTSFNIVLLVYLAILHCSKLSTLLSSVTQKDALNVSSIRSIRMSLTRAE